jgi:hypothetical protein
LRVELFHAAPCLLIFRALLDIIEDVINGFFRVVARNSVSDVGKQLGVMFDSLWSTSERLRAVRHLALPSHTGLT